MSKVKTYQPVIGGNVGPHYLDVKEALNEIVEGIFEQANVTLTKSAFDVVVAGLATMLFDHEGTQYIGPDYEIAIGSMDREEFDNLHEFESY